MLSSRSLQLATVLTAQCSKSLSTTSVVAFKYKKLDLIKLRQHVLDNPHFGKEGEKGNVLPDGLGESVGNFRFELLAKLYGEKHPFENKRNAIKPNAKDVHQLVPGFEHRRMLGCACYEDRGYINWMMLHKDYPNRCRCGFWFKLVDYDVYYEDINKKRQVAYYLTKDDPKLKDLESKLESKEKEFQALLDKSRPMTRDSPGATELKIEMKETWDQILALRAEIENMLDAELSSKEKEDLYQKKTGQPLAGDFKKLEQAALQA